MPVLLPKRKYQYHLLFNYIGCGVLIKVHRILRRRHSDRRLRRRWYRHPPLRRQVVQKLFVKQLSCSFDRISKYACLLDNVHTDVSSRR